MTCGIQQMHNHRSVTACEAQGSDKVVPSLMGAVGEADAHTVGKHREKGAVCSVTRVLLQDNGGLEMGPCVSVFVPVNTDRRAASLLSRFFSS